MWFISEHSYAEVLEYYIDNPAKSRKLNIVKSNCWHFHAGT